jgi:hypothetical protein
MIQARTGVETVEFRSPDGKKTIVVFPNQVFAVTHILDGTTSIIGPANAVMFVDGSVKEARDKLVAALTHAPKTGE